MKRYGGFGIIAALIIFLSAYMAGADPNYVTDSKHDLSYKPTGTYQAASNDPNSGGTTQICVFCHTPHGGNTAAPLWNRTTLGSYQTYTSDVLAGLNYWAAEDPLSGGTHVKTAICLSCHDGTIALGSVANMPSDIASGYTEIAMRTSKIATSSAGYIGENLSDDHPVAIKYDNTKDTELASLPLSGSIKLYRMVNGQPMAMYSQASTGDFVECTSCHDPHKSVYGKFLVESNKNAALCIKCHTKTGFAASVHADNSIAVGYAPPTGETVPHGPMVGDVKCMNCHFPHKAGVLDTNKTNPVPAQGKYLLSFNEEQSCFNTNNDRWNTSGSNAACHGTAAGNNKNIETYIDQNYKHDVKSRIGRHRPTEGMISANTNYPGWIHEGGDQAKWHVECADCHNPHTAGSGVHTSPLTGVLALLTSTSSIYGVSGVDVTFPGSWTAPSPATAYTFVKSRGVTETTSVGVDMEYKICFKCHTAYAWSGGSVPTSPSLGAGSSMTDQALEFNTANAAYHPVVGANTVNNQGTYINSWTSGSTQMMYCSDCHSKSGGGAPQGPHGSGEKFILTNAYTDSTSAVITDIAQPNTDLCFQCHDYTVYANPALTANTDVTGFTASGTNYNLHRIHADKATSSGISTHPYRCVNCHTRIPHGWKRKAMIVLQGEGAANGSQYYEPAGGAFITAISPDPVNSGAYGGRDVNCTTVSGCHHNP